MRDRVTAIYTLALAVLGGVVFGLLLILLFGCDGGHQPDRSDDVAALAAGFPEVEPDQITEAAPPSDQVDELETFSEWEAIDGDAFATTDLFRFPETPCKLTISGYKVEAPVDADGYCVVHFDGTTYGWRP